MAQEDRPTGEMVLDQSQDGTTRVECRFADETLWLSQGLIAELFQTTPQNVTQHLRSIFREGELNPEATCKGFLQVRQEGGRRVRRQVKHYNLDAILAVGYRVRSPRGTLFRTWATQRLSEYLVKGFTMDDERLTSRRSKHTALYFCPKLAAPLQRSAAIELILARHPASVGAQLLGK